jgi:hypothetical protein
MDSVPKCEDLERFLFTVPDLVESSSSSRTALSWATLQLALKYTIHFICCRHDSFTLSYGERQRIRDVFETLRTQDKITKEPTREAQWVTTQLVSHLTRSLLVEAIRYGVTDWSIVIQKCLGLALQSALSSRVGDVAVSRYYEDNECIAYQHVLLKVMHGPQTLPSDVPLLDRVRFEAKVTLKYTKGKKRDPSRNHVVALSSLDDVEFNVVDPLKLLLVHALRQDAVQGATTAEQAAQQALARRDNLIAWKYPERPILCSLPAHKFDFARGAKPQQLLDTLREAATLSGIGQILITHDIRRGAASDATQLRPRRTMELAAQALDHSGASFAKGITGKYAGYETKSTFGDRLRVEPSDHFGLQNIDTRSLPSTGKRRKVARTEIDEFLGLPENAQFNKLKAPRHAAARAINKTKSAALANELHDVQEAITINAEEIDDQATQLDDVQAMPLQSWSPNEMNISNNHANGSTRDINDGPPAPKKRKKTNDGDWQNIDPALLLLSGISAKTNLQLPIDVTAAQSTQSILLEEMMFEHSLEVVPPPNDDGDDKSKRSRVITAAQVEMQQLEAPASEFLPWLSRINTRVVNDTNPAQHSDLDHLRGGSRDEPTFFIQHCKYETDGCTFSTTSGPSLTYHENTCTPARRETEAYKTLQLACDIPACKYIARADTQEKVSKKMKRHKRENHVKISPVSCPIGGRPECVGPFEDKVALSRHKAKCHCDITPQTCPIDGCQSKTKWATMAKLSDHFRKTHYMKGKELADLMAAAKTLDPVQ